MHLLPQSFDLRPGAVRRVWAGCLAGVLVLAALWPAQAQATRIKEVAAIQGVRTNALTGYGLVVGLDGTGDQTTQTPFTTQSLQAMLQQMGVTVPAGASMQLRNVAAVMVTAQLPAFAQPGQTIDVNVSSLGNAKSLRGGTLIATPLKAGVAMARDGRTVSVAVPADPGERIGFLADIENLRIELAKPAARVVLNARTGSVVLNESVMLGACAVAHGSLSVTISSTPSVSQPAPFSQGQTTVTEKTDITITQQGGALMQLPAGARLADVVRALNALGATPQDLLAILQAMRTAGALQAEIEVI